MSYGIGVVGTGFMGSTWTQVAAHQLPECHMVGVTGGRRARGLAAEHGCRLFQDLAAMAADPDIDVVVLATPPAGHLAQAITLASAGKHLLVEKPMAQSVQECRRMVEVAHSAGVTLAVVSQHRFRTVPQAVKGALDAGQIGTVTMIRATGANVGFWDTSLTGDQWKLDPGQQTAYASWAAHACDLIRWYLADEADLAFAMMTGYTPEPPPGRSAMVSYRFAGGQMAQLWMSYDIPPPGLGSGLDLLLVGTKGMIELDAYQSARLGVADGWTTIARQLPMNPSDPRDPVRLQAYAAQLADLLAAVGQHRRPLVDGRAGLHTTAMLDAAAVSAATGLAVAMDPGTGDVIGGRT